MVNGLKLDHIFDFQEQAVLRLIDFTTNSNSKQTIVMKAPTGAGKTIILIDFVVNYIDHVDKNTAFIWLCPGKGDLEDQSRKKMQAIAPQRITQNLFDALQNGFTPESTTFINWELVTKRKNTAIRESERKNLFDRIAEANRNHINFVVIIDEEHSNNTSKARKIIDSFAAKHVIRVSATAQYNKKFELFEIDEQDVINAGLITKAIYVNEGIEENVDVSNDYDTLLDLADAKRKEIDSHYRSLGKEIRPLVLIQFPSGQPETIEAVENKLKSMGYSYENGLASKWMSEDKKDLPDNLTENNGTPVFLLMKQAISTGWDCPRAKILVKLREGMSEQFTIQTIGRIRRMPEAKHYDDDILDCCYVYTFDEEYKNGLLSDMDKAYETRRLFLKDKCKTFSLEKQIRDREYHGLGEREIWNRTYNLFMNKYKLSTNPDSTKKFQENETILTGYGYQFGSDLLGKALKGTFIKTDMIGQSDDFIRTRQKVDTHKHGIQLLHCTDDIKHVIGISTAKVKTILERLFRKGRASNKKVLSLDTAEFYAFIINNVHLLKEEFREVASQHGTQIEGHFQPHPKVSQFYIPEQDFFKYDPGVKNEITYLSNAYQNYTSGFATSLIRSTPEQLFEQYCEEREDIDWVYKNGDSGQQYFSIVYLDSLWNQWLFYADYIVKKKDGTVWVIETKGGESKGQDKNIDRQIENKFYAFKNYANEHNLKWGFVRDKDNKLYLNNSEFSIDMADEHWQPIGDIF